MDIEQVSTTQNNSGQKSLASDQEAEAHFSRNLYLYYAYYFPYEHLFKWLSYPNDKHEKALFNPVDNFMKRREFSFEVSIMGTEVYQRYQSFTKPAELQRALLGGDKNDSMESSVQKIDIGAVFDSKPSKTDAITPLQKEFVIDIDMTDYDETRTCCQGATICPKCWNFMKVACEVLYRALLEDFGFEHILWIYSGRRGIHLWVCDEHARLMPNSQRKAIVGYLSLCKDKEHKLRVPLRPKGNHPMIERSLKIVQQYFQHIILEQQNLLVKEHAQTYVLETIQERDKDLAATIKNQWSKLLIKGAQSQQLWDELVKLKKIALEDKKKPSNIDCIDEELMLMFLYPRLDAHVSTTINHLLKGPFCIHPKTQRVCVPFTYEHFKEFNPFHVPTLPQLCDEISRIDPSYLTRQGDMYPNLGQKSAILRPYLDIFESFLDNYNKRQDIKHKADKDKVEKAGGDKW